MDINQCINILKGRSQGSSSDCLRRSNPSTCIDCSTPDEKIVEEFATFDDLGLLNLFGCLQGERVQVRIFRIWYNFCF